MTAPTTSGFQKFLALFAEQASLSGPDANPKARVATVSTNGSQYVTLAGQGAGAPAIVPVADTSEDGVDPTNALPTASYLYALDPSGTFTRLLTTVDNADAQASVITGALLTLARNIGYNGATWDRLRALTDADALASVVGSLVTLARNQGYNGATWDRLRALTDADAQASVLGSLVSLARQEKFNGTTWDRARNNTESTLLASAARTVQTNSADQTNYSAKGLHVQLNVTAASGTGGLTVVVQGKDPVSGTYYDILVGTAIIATGITILKVYPGIVASANAAASDILPRTWRVQVRVGDASSYTYSVGSSLVT